ncbi:TetR/AcrR family transcriptional regulator [Psychromonas ossibalaenae]|uniref:TetR/AcrR family transcriptional regulator n=1 Tax=Psychromonas ossibalaenae TaxID=444922 RepID=UPI00036FE088|nr:TetR/AcrR family transcriptional regulator [Psychromonas ossibalaenae]
MRPSTLLKRQKIIAAATQLFFKQGYPETSLDQIIEQCGGSKQTLYRYFGDKKGILNEVITQGTEEMKSVFQFQNDSDIPLTKQLNEFGYLYIKTLCSPQLLNMYRIVITESRRDQELAEFFLSRGPQHFHHLLTEFLLQQAEQGKLHINNASLAATRLLGLLRGDFFQQAMLGMPSPSEQEMHKSAQQAVKFFLQGCSIAD